MVGRWTLVLLLLLSVPISAAEAGSAPESGALATDAESAPAATPETDATIDEPSPDPGNSHLAEPEAGAQAGATTEAADAHAGVQVTIEHADAQIETDVKGSIETTIQAVESVTGTPLIPDEVSAEDISYVNLQFHLDLHDDQPSDCGPVCNISALTEPLVPSPFLSDPFVVPPLDLSIPQLFLPDLSLPESPSNSEPSSERPVTPAAQMRVASQGIVYGGSLLSAALAAVLGVGLSVSLVAFPGFRRVIARSLRPLFSLLLFTRIDHDRALDHPRRTRIFQYVREHPGERFQDVRRALGLPNGVVLHHVRILAGANLLRLAREGRRCRLFDAEAGAAEPWLSPLQHQLLDVLRITPGLSQRALARAVGVSDRTMSYHMTALSRHSLVRFNRDGTTKRCFLNDATPVVTPQLQSR